MRSLLTRLGVAFVACAVAIPVATSVAATRQQAQVKARMAANHYTNGHYGIGFATSGGWQHWSATCTRRAATGGWSCSVRMEGGQCHGTLKLSRALRPFAHRIGCLE